MYFDLSTNSRATVRKIAAAFAEKGVHMLDAPVSGGPRGAKTGKCAIWVDASVAGSFVADKTQSKVSEHAGFAYAPHQVSDKSSAWLYSWSLAIPASSKANTSRTHWRRSAAI